MIEWSIEEKGIGKGHTIVRLPEGFELKEEFGVDGNKQSEN